MSDFSLSGYMRKIQDFSRPYLFYCKIFYGTVFVDHVYLVKSTSLPAQSIKDATADWQGNQYKIATTNDYADFTITFMSDKDMLLRESFYSWMEEIHNVDTNIHGRPGASGGYFGKIILDQLSGQNDVLQSYTLYGAWPTGMKELSLDYSKKELASFDVTFKYQYHLLNDGTTGHAGA